MSCSSCNTSSTSFDGTGSLLNLDLALLPTHTTKHFRKAQTGLSRCKSVKSTPRSDPSISFACRIWGRKRQGAFEAWATPFSRTPKRARLGIVASGVLAPQLFRYKCQGLQIAIFQQYTSVRVSRILTVFFIISKSYDSHIVIFNFVNYEGILVVFCISPAAGGTICLR